MNKILDKESVKTLVFKHKDSFTQVFKSDYTFNTNKIETILKHSACINLGFKHEVWIFDRNKNLQEIIK